MPRAHPGAGALAAGARDLGRALYIHRVGHQRQAADQTSRAPGRQAAAAARTFGAHLPILARKPSILDHFIALICPYFKTRFLQYFARNHALPFIKVKRQPAGVWDVLALATAKQCRCVISPQLP